MRSSSSSGSLALGESSGDQGQEGPKESPRIDILTDSTIMKDIKNARMDLSHTGPLIPKSDNIVCDLHVKVCKNVYAMRFKGSTSVPKGNVGQGSYE